VGEGQNAAARAELEDWIERVESLGKLAAGIAPEIAVELDRELRANIAAGRGPDGIAWPPTKDGKPALRGAGKALTVRAVGKVVLATLTGPEARHHLGAVRGGVRRQILPTTTLPAPMVAAIQRFWTQRAAATMRGAR
jgi:hypothetical protein